MNMKLVALSATAALGAFVLAVAIPDWHGMRFHGTQMGYRANASVQFESRAQKAPINVELPDTLPPAAPGGAKATDTYKNVTVLTDVSAAEFMRLQYALTQWVAPKQGCGFCHEGSNFASDAKPTKLAARRMLQMTRYINAAWKTHVQPSGMTCFTCHRGQPVPQEAWFPRQTKPVQPGVDKEDNWNEAADTVTRFFPNSGFAEYYLQDNPVAGQSVTALRSNRVADTVVFKRIYEMMMQMSLQIGVNCGFCHNSRAFADWSQSSPYRWVGYYALNMIRDLNRTYMLPFAQIIPQQSELIKQTAIPVIPAYQGGQQSGNALLTCETCHYRLVKPLEGANMLKDYPGLVGREPDAKDSDPNTAITRASLAQMQKPDLGSHDLDVGAGN